VYVSGQAAARSLAPQPRSCEVPSPPVALVAQVVEADALLLAVEGHDGGNVVAVLALVAARAHALREIVADLQAAARPSRRAGGRSGARARAASVAHAGPACVVVGCCCCCSRPLMGPPALCDRMPHAPRSSAAMLADRPCTVFSEGRCGAGGGVGTNLWVGAGAILVRRSVLHPSCVGAARVLLIAQRLGRVVSSRVTCRGRARRGGRFGCRSCRMLLPAGVTGFTPGVTAARGSQRPAAHHVAGCGCGRRASEEGEAVGTWGDPGCWCGSRAGCGGLLPPHTMRVCGWGGGGSTMRRACHPTSWPGYAAAPGTALHARHAKGAATAARGTRAGAALSHHGR